MDNGGAYEEEKPSRFPSPLGLLIMISIASWLLALVLPSGQFAMDDAGRPS